MKIRNTILFAAVAVLFCSCIPSINPFYTEKDRVFNPTLLGEWETKKPDDLDIWKFEKDGTNSYKLTVTEEKDKTGVFNATLFKLKEETFLDLIPASCNFAEKQMDLSAFMVRGHLLARAQVAESKLRLTFMDMDWLTKHLEKNPDALAHHKDGNGMVLIANTRDLQSFVLGHLNDLFKEPGELVRHTPAATKPQSN